MTLPKLHVHQPLLIVRVMCVWIMLVTYTYHQRNGFDLEKRIEQLTYSVQVHQPNADRYDSTKAACARNPYLRFQITPD